MWVPCHDISDSLGGCRRVLVSCEAELVFAPSFTLPPPLYTATVHKLKMKGAILWRCAGTTLCLCRISEEYRVWPSWTLSCKKNFNLARIRTEPPLPPSTSQSQLWGNISWWVIRNTTVALRDLQLRSVNSGTKTKFSRSICVITTLAILRFWSWALSLVR